jgi:large conductance mechanosensitive channel
MFRGFRDFVLRGNVIDLAVGVVIGAAFGAVVTSFTANVLTPLIAGIVGKPDFSYIGFTLNGSRIMLGAFLNALISFLLVAAAIYYFVVLPVNAFMARMKRAEAPVPPGTKKCPECLSEVPIDARRCAYCTTPIGAGSLT